ncbi:plastid-lipid-associated protein, chloroplastic-like [Corylus avellana]|uniref:plastid-lipid-associated protein, chloroplastic-like n=1 Tax=Corylus avellana TaxID=13451 RepID=UPI001E20E26A|nr:plastid-lipid-associated protein, chloroplastic-like [Corylus avellana]
MASVSFLNQFPCKTLSVPQFISKPAIFAPNSVKIGPKRIGKSCIRAWEFVQERPSFRVRAAEDDKLGMEKEEGPSKAASSVAVAVADEVVKLAGPSDIDRLKKPLVHLFCGTDRGLKATSETRAKIDELITQLEVKNPTPAPTEALALLNGKWILKYTSSEGLFPLLSGGILPILTVEEISQTIYSENSTVQNCVTFSGPLAYLATASVKTNSKFEVRSPKSVQIKLEEGIIGTPQFLDSIEIPEDVEFLGQKIDLTPFKGLINSVQETASSVAKTISSQPPVKFSIPNSKDGSWLLTTYLDEELRISRGEGGSVFVLIKEGSSLLTP